MNETKNALFIVLPVYNECAAVRSVICSLQAEGFQNIIVVDDGSTEPVFSYIGDLKIHYIKHAINLGQGAALQTGFWYALQQGAAIIVTFDADGQHDVTDVPALIKPIEEGKADVVFGSRFLTGKSSVPIVRYIILQGARFINFCFSGLLLSDAHNGLRAFGSAALQKIVLTENRMAHASELLAEVRKHKLRILEKPVTVHYTAYAQQKGQRNSDSLKILFDLFLYKFFK